VGTVDVRRATVEVVWARDVRAREALELAAQAAAALFAPSGIQDGDEAPPHEAIVVSDVAVHAFAREPRTGRLFAAVARGGASVGLLLASERALRAAEGRMEAR
jgi:hypothetical protein